MAHAKCTKETVFEAADQLLADGEKPTITRIRDVIGGGSPNDITAWMKEWRTRRQKITDAQRVPAPGNIKDQANVFLNDFIATVWDTAVSVQPFHIVRLPALWFNLRSGKAAIRRCGCWTR